MRITDLQDEQEPGTYVGVRFADETIDGLKKFQADHDIPNPLKSEKFHTTLVYSRAPIEWEPNEDLVEQDCATKNWHVFDTRDGMKCLVLLLDSDYLQERFDTAIELGATHDFPDYKPHITLSYDIGTLDIKKLPLPEFDVILDHEYVEELDNDWSKK